MRNPDLKHGMRVWGVRFWRTSLRHNSPKPETPIPKPIQDETTKRYSRTTRLSIPNREADRPEYPKVQIAKPINPKPARDEPVVSSPLSASLRPSPAGLQTHTPFTAESAPIENTMAQNDVFSGISRQGLQSRQLIPESEPTKNIVSCHLQGGTAI